MPKTTLSLTPCYSPPSQPADMIAFELNNHRGRAAWAHAALSALLLVLLATLSKGMHIGDCWDDGRCIGTLQSSISGNPLPNAEFKITGICKSFRSDTGKPYKIDLCTDTACSRLEFNQCYGSGDYKTIEVLPIEVE